MIQPNIDELLAETSVKHRILGCWISRSAMAAPSFNHLGALSLRPKYRDIPVLGGGTIALGTVSYSDNFLTSSQASMPVLRVPISHQKVNQGQLLHGSLHEGANQK